MKNKVLLILMFVIIVAVGLYFYAYKEHRDIATEQSDFRLTVIQLNKEYEANDSLANHKYADKIVEISGKVTSTDGATHTVFIDEKLSAVFSDSILPKISIQDSIKVKGRFVGYDDLLEEFKVDQATLVE